MDLRIKRTRKFIREAFFNLLLEKGFPTITVGDITERAMVNRSTFYRHYADKYDLAEKCLDVPFTQLLGQIQDDDGREDLPPGAPPHNFLLLFRHIEENANLYRALFGKNGVSIFKSRLRTFILEILRVRLRDVKWEERVSGLPQEMFEEYLTGAYMGVIQWWLENIKAYSAETVAFWVYALAAKGAEAALTLPEK